MNQNYFLKSFVIALFLATGINTFIANIIDVRGSSMKPTLEEGDRLLLKKYKAVFKLEKYRNGDIIVFKSPLKDNKGLYVKRIVGIAGDKINIIDGKVYVNDKYLEESYIDDEVFTEALIYGKDFIVPENEVFVIGDNRLPGKSNDSRLFSSIPIESVAGKVSYRVSPFNKIDKNL